MSDPDIALIEGAAEALNTTDARINGFLDSVDDEVDQRLDAAQATLLVRQQAYDDLAEDLQAIVPVVMEQVIDWLPNEAANNPVNGGHVRTWIELRNFLNSRPSGSTLVIQMQDGVHHLDAHSLEDFERLGSVTFKGIGSTIAGSRPSINMTPVASGGVINAAETFPITNAKLSLIDVDINMGVGPVANAGFHSSNMWLRVYGNSTLYMKNVKVIGEPPYFARLYPASNLRASLTNVEFEDGITGFKAGGNLSLSTSGIILNGTAALHESFTLGTDLLET